MVEIADILHLYGSQYRAKYGNRILPSHRKVMRVIECCRTAALGGHVYRCAACEETQYMYHCIKVKV
jgi:hypothetical protein